MSDFGKAFRAARNAGDKTFTWNGKTYTTQLKDESVTPSSKATNPQTASEMLSKMPAGTSAAAAQALGALAAKEQAGQASLQQRMPQEIWKMTDLPQPQETWVHQCPLKMMASWVKT